MWLIRDGWEDEHQALNGLQRRASDIWPEDRDGPQRSELSLWTLRSGRVRVAEGDEQVLGFAVMLMREGEDCRLDGLFTDPEGWRRGVGRALIVDAIHLARAEGAQTLSVNARGAGEGFYKHMGFAVSPLETHQSSLTLSF